MASPTSFASPQRFKGHNSPKHEALGARDEMRAKAGSEAVASWEIEGRKSEGSMTVFVEHGVSCGGWDKVPLQEKAGGDNGSVLEFSGRESDGVDGGMRQQ
jgi:hypothetical protein